jgi:hypothetical protein
MSKKTKNIKIVSELMEKNRVKKNDGITMNKESKMSKEIIEVSQYSIRLDSITGLVGINKEINPSVSWWFKIWSGAVFFQNNYSSFEECLEEYNRVRKTWMDYVDNSKFTDEVEIRGIQNVDAFPKMETK